MNSAPAANPVLADVTLLVFSCVGRAHLLRATLASFRQHCPFAFAETIYAHDGEMEPAAPAEVGATRLVQSCQRRGYVQSIRQALALVRTPYVFWLEDDWEFTAPIALADLRAALAAHEPWVQIRLSKVAPLPAAEQAVALDVPGLHRSACGFSANPHLGRAAHLRAGFAAYYESPPTAENTFESFLENWLVGTPLVCVVVDPGAAATVRHSGYLESTGRQWHAAAALAGTPTAYASGLHGVGERPPLGRRLVLASRLILAAANVGLRLLHRRSAYDLAFRFVDLSRQKAE